MQAIVTRYLGPTNTKGGRIKASCEAGSVTIGYSHELDSDGAHRLALNALCNKLNADARKRHPEAGTTYRPWRHEDFVQGGMPGGDGCCFVSQGYRELLRLLSCCAELSQDSLEPETEELVIKCQKVLHDDLVIQRRIEAAS